VECPKIMANEHTCAEMRLILATTLWHFDLHLLEESLDWHDQKIYILWEKKPLIVRAVPRVL
jgi:hypothetical protein